MKKEDFNLGDYYFESEVDGVLIKIGKDTMNEETVAYANKVLELYLSMKPEIIDFILNDSILDFYESSYTKDQIVKKLNEPDITILSDKWGTLTWLNHELDEHIIVVEFDHDMQLSYVSIDG